MNQWLHRHLKTITSTQEKSPAPRQLMPGANHK